MAALGAALGLAGIALVGAVSTNAREEETPRELRKARRDAKTVSRDDRQAMHKKCRGEDDWGSFSITYLSWDAKTR